MPYFYFNNFNKLQRDKALRSNIRRRLSRFRQFAISPILSGMVVAVMATQAASASQTGNQLPYRHCFEATAKTYNLDSDWLTAIAIVES
ncbi:MAG: hypothetical protein VX137_08010, partial [Pseudomonadota bacterium]|nr:hypothetical protein [Pseudomonadota bacterium]